MVIKEGILKLFSGVLGSSALQNYPLDYCIPLYHTVSDGPLPHLKNLYRYKSVKAFEKDLDFLGRQFRFVDWEEFTRYSDTVKRPKKKIALLTFDDGLTEFLDVVAPILERKGIYAINFVNPAFVDQKDLMFRCKASLLAEQLLATEQDLSKLKEIPGFQLSGKDDLIRYVLATGYKKREELDAIADVIGLNFSDYIKTHKPYLNREELHQLKARGFGIAAHSWDHPYYSELTLNEQIDSTVKSLEYMKLHGFLSDSFAFPFTDFGVSKEFFDRLFSDSKMTCSFGTAGLKKDSFCRNFQRIPMEDADAESALKRELVYWQVKKAFNKNIIIRK
jgi:peptidoglycan/xylan/chitin deacetylase (PgdA/CDA1 family)